MNEAQKEKIRRFLQDKIMSDTIREVLINSFLKPRGDKDIHTLAASRMAIDLLDEAYKELKKLSVEEQKSEKKLNNLGL